MDYETDREFFIVRIDGRIAFIGTVFFLWYWEVYEFCIWYMIFASDLLWEHDEMMEDDFVELRHLILHYFNDQARIFFEELHVEHLGGYDWDITDILDMRYEEVSLPVSYTFIKSYNDWIFESPLVYSSKQKFLESFYLNEEKITANNITDLVMDVEYSKLAEKRLVLTDSFYKYYHFTFYGIDNYLQFRCLEWIHNAFLGDCFVSAGIYPDSEYDFNFYLAHDISLNIIVDEFLFLSDLKLNPLFFESINFKGHIANFYIHNFTKIMPTSTQLQQYLTGKTQTLVSNFVPEEDKLILNEGCEFEEPVLSECHDYNILLGRIYETAYINKKQIDEEEAKVKTFLEEGKEDKYMRTIKKWCLPPDEKQRILYNYKKWRNKVEPNLPDPPSIEELREFYLHDHGVYVDGVLSPRYSGVIGDKQDIFEIKY